MLKEQEFNELIFMGDYASAQISLCMNLHIFPLFPLPESKDAKNKIYSQLYFVWL
ncbi:MAG: hypothetical protein LBT69_01405 [Lactobacillales bacterium]|nr:hypothetical protein [Lactobacillales bacterium]